MGECSFPKNFFQEWYLLEVFHAQLVSFPEGFFLLLLLQVFFQHLLIVGCLLPCRTKWLPRRFAPMKESIDYEDAIIFFTENTPFFFFGLDSSIPKQNGGRHLEVGQGSTSHRHTSVKP